MGYLYRDWVISVFNDDLPFDQFVKLQRAADLLDKTEWQEKPTGAYDDEQMWGRLQVVKWDGLKEDERRKIVPYGHIVDDSLDKKNLPALGLLGIGPWYYDLGDAKQMRSEERGRAQRPCRCRDARLSRRNGRVRALPRPHVRPGCDQGLFMRSQASSTTAPITSILSSNKRLSNTGDQRTSWFKHSRSVSLNS